ncbi:MAG: dephospho-CoA kinase [Cryomorphaceae bacterium]|jgi:dephospho-CoA kinase|nr:dephospho-CoA kinase [Cryomorphaceae bacterium]
MLRIGLSGGIGSGKSTVAGILAKMGYPVFYSDQEAKRLYDENPVLQKQLVDLFGPAIYRDGQLNKAFLAQQLFSNAELKAQVTALVHPLVRKAFEVWAQQQTSDLIFNEAAILFETGAYKDFDATVLVMAPIETRIERVQKRDLISREAVLQRIANQWPDSKKMNLTTYIITNDGQPLLQQIEDVISKLKTA